MSLVIVLMVILLMVGANAFFVAGEFATIGARRSRLAEMADSGNRAARRILPIVESPARLDNYVAACQLGITLSSLVLGFYGESSLSGVLERRLSGNLGLDESIASPLSTVVVLVLLTIFQIVVGETVPKAIAMRGPERLAVWLSTPMLLTVRLFQPAISFFNGTALLLLRLLGVRKSGGHSRVHSPEEIRMLASDSHLAGQLGELERNMLDNAMLLSSLKARMVMIPRNRLVMADVSMAADEMLSMVIASPYSRVPVFDEDPDHILGIVHVKDLFRLSLSGQSDVGEIVRPVPALPENTPVHEVWQALTRQRRYMAVLIDEYGGTAGIVTQEDLLEEIIGEVQDEFDEETARWIDVPDGETVLVRGDVLIDDVNDELALHLPTDGADTIGGLVLDALGRLPQVGEVIEVDGIALRVTQMRRNWIAQVAVPKASVVPPASEEDPGTEEVEPEEHSS